MEVTLAILLTFYFGIGFIYALWIFLFGYDRWYWFPINWFLAIPNIVVMTYFVVTGKKNPLGKY